MGTANRHGTDMKNPQAIYMDALARIEGQTIVKINVGPGYFDEVYGMTVLPATSIVLDSGQVLRLYASECDHETFVELSIESATGKTTRHPNGRTHRKKS